MGHRGGVVGGVSFRGSEDSHTGRGLTGGPGLVGGGTAGMCLEDRRTSDGAAAVTEGD